MLTKLSFILALSCISLSKTQFISMQHKHLPYSCSNATKTALVEHFFNLIFYEFHHNPPVCVCVQMCVDTPTYCYPNGCLKRIDNRKKETVNTYMQLPSEKKPLTFLVPDQSNSLRYAYEKFNEVDINGRERNDKSLISELRPDPFKDRFRSSLKYRKMPKVHLRYNLREQVKNMKSDVLKIEKIDFAKTRWPVRKHLNGNNMFTKIRQDNMIVEPKLGLIKISDKSHIISPTKFIKRELASVATNDNASEIKKDTETSAYELESIIENLIEHSFGTAANDTNFDVNLIWTYNISKSTTNEPITVPRILPLQKQNTKMIINETMNIISINATNENIEQNKYEDVSREEIFTSSVKNMIASLSKTIDKENNCSLELMEKIVGNGVEESTVDTIEIPTEITNYTVTINTTDSSSTTVKPEMTTRKRGWQKMIRRQQNGKINKN